MRISTAGFQAETLQDILGQESNIARLNREVATGQTLLSAADDPANAGLVVALSDRIDRLSVDRQNASEGQRMAEQAVSVLDQVNSVLDQIKTVALEASSGTISDDQRAALVGSVQGALQELIQLANTQLPDGRYLFGGSKTAAEPFHLQPDGTVAFTGDSGIDKLEIAPGLTAPVSASGQDVFMNVPDGNGSFAAAASGSNTGTGVAVLGGVVDPATVKAEHLAGTQFAISFADVGGSLSYTVVSGTGEPGSASFAATSGMVQSGGFTSGTDLTFGGMDVRIDGDPAVGDEFVVRTSENRSIFQTVRDLADSLQAPSTGTGVRARLQQGLQAVLAQIGTAQSSVLSAEASLGTGLAEIKAIGGQTDSLISGNQQSQSDLQDADVAEVVSRLANATTALQAAELAFARVSGLSLFQFIG